MVRIVRPEGTDVLLDAAAGPGFTALQFSEMVSSTVIHDGTPGMLRKAMELVKEKKARNCSFVLSTLPELPLPDGAFTVVTCRRALHHFHNVHETLREFRRVLAPGGRLCISDMVAPAGWEEQFNRLEWMRDSSHHWALSEEEMLMELEEAGFREVEHSIMVNSLDFDQWLSPLDSESAQGMACRAYLEKLSGEGFPLARPGGLMKLHGVYLAVRD
ncbi:hypothetical protein GCM10007108_06610 [Thermogymnomonas acidicola]|uniref:Methyltransferase type 11 domain-containing protein n=2 Tax=Thermogymnomonas acidicola TaxID=399579 RepID=A0AA37BQM3_9ARCH|nr:hypothetical protein GCM10007108_06610 [Thermogymnomonas acidicola]